jgi:hypothetical protein
MLIATMLIITTWIPSSSQNSVYVDLLQAYTAVYSVAAEHTLKTTNREWD